MRPGLVITLAIALCACSAESDFGDVDTEYGMNGPLEPTPPPGKYDAEHRKGLPASTTGGATMAWAVRNQWEDTDTPAARAAGIAWPADSGLTWDAKFARWVGSLERTSSTSYYETYLLTTPWGVTLPSPALECAEMSIFLRVTFAAWYELPFYMEAVDRDGKRVYFGHFGVRTSAGRYANTPSFRDSYPDYAAMPRAEYEASWPSDPKLRARKLWGGEDRQDMLGDGKTFGDYLDAIHLNKRAGHLTALMLGYLGSINLADTANTYNVVADAVRPGDTLLERWQRRGIGHTLVVKDVVEIGEGNLDVTLVSGSMPRRQGKWESGVASKQYFTNPYTGGPGQNGDGDAYARLGGGLKRWRVAKAVAGTWSNTWMRGDEAHWINSTDYARIAERPARFEVILGEVSPEQQRDALLEVIEDARQHLRRYPASCSARIRREEAFAKLYDLLEREFGVTRARADELYRTLEDYVYGELEYAASKTCCWNSTNATMHEVVMDFAAAELAAAGDACVAPTVFKNHTDGYERWRRFAQETGRGGAWVAWSEDESCPQRNAAEDVEADPLAVPWCERAAGDGGGDIDTCADAREPNDERTDAPQLSSGDAESLTICAGDVDWFHVPLGGTVTITFSHAAGDLDLAAYDAAGARVTVSQGTTDSETVTIPAGGYAHVYGYQGATGAYSLRVD